MTKPCPGWKPNSVNPPAHEGGYCCWVCDHDWDDADCTCLEPPEPEVAATPLDSSAAPDPEEVGGGAN